MLLKHCRFLYSHYLDVTHTINSLESMNMAYRWGKHKEYYFERLEFYNHILKSGSLAATLNFPKILRDLFVLRKNVHILEKNKHDVRVQSALGKVGDPNWNIGTFYK